MALFSECMQSCARKVLDTADIVRDGDISSTQRRSWADRGLSGHLWGMNELANIRCMPQTPEEQLKSFIAKFDPKLGKQIRECRSAMRKRFPTANELAYDNYNFFVIGYCTTERPSDCVVSLAVNAKGIGLSFYYGATLPDPSGILQGSGKQNRFVRLDGVATLRRPEVEELLDAAEAQADPPFAKSSRGKLIIRSISEKQRLRK